MKVLVAEKNPLVQFVLRQALQNGGLSAEYVEDGVAAMAYLNDLQVPCIALLSSELEGVSALKMIEKCAGRNPERMFCPFIVSLSTETRTVVEGMEAGALDVLVLPMAPEIILAKIGAAQKLIKRIEIIAAGGHLEETNYEPTPPNVRATSSTLSKKMLVNKAFASVNSAVISAISGLGLDDVVGVKQISYAEKEPIFAMWCTVVVPTIPLWLDVLIESDRKSAMMLFQKLTGMPPASGKDALDTVGEVVNIVQGAVKSCFQAEGQEAITPIVPRAVPSAKLAKLNEHMVDRIRIAVDAGGISLSVTVFASSRPVMRKTVDDLKQRDVTLEALTMPGMDVKLLNRGVMLEDRIILALREKLKGEGRRLSLNIMEAPGLLDLLRSA
jgi:CheY-like chemotaxis protein